MSESRDEMTVYLREAQMVVVTGYPLGGKARDPLPQGILGWVEKPFLVEKLAQVLHQALKES